jgi:hypothetical protein
VVPVWLLVPVLVLGVLVGAALGWWMRQRMLAAATQPRHWGAEPAPPAVVVVPDLAADQAVGEGPVARAQGQAPQPGPAPAADAQSQPEPPPLPPETEAATVQAHAPEVQQPAELTPEPAPEVKPEAAAEATPEPAREVKPEAAADVTPELEPEPEASSEPSGQPDTVPVEGERLDARMDDVLSELERRYRGRRVGPADAPEEPKPTSRPRRPRRQP